MSVIKKTNIVDQVLELYEIDENTLSEMIDIPKSSINTWKNSKDKGISKAGRAIMNLLIENYKLKKADSILKELFALYK